MEIKQLRTSSLHEAGAELVVKDQFGVETDFRIRLVGVDSPCWREVKREIERDSLEAIYGDGKPKHDQAYYLAKATLGWTGLTDEGKPVKFTREMAEQLYRAAPYIADQVDRFIDRKSVV